MARYENRDDFIREVVVVLLGEEFAPFYDLEGFMTALEANEVVNQDGDGRYGWALPRLRAEVEFWDMAERFDIGDENVEALHSDQT